MDAEVNSIEITFAIPVEVTSDDMRDLCEIVQRIAKANEPEGCVHWQFGCGSKILWADADVAAFPDLPGGRSGEASGEPGMDHSVIHISTSCRERYPDERATPPETGEQT